MSRKSFSNVIFFDNLVSLFGTYVVVVLNGANLIKKRLLQ